MGKNTCDLKAQLVYRIPDLARMLGFSTHAVRRMVERQQIPSRRLGTRVIVLADELRTFLKSLPRPGQGLNAPEDEQTTKEG